MWTDATSRDYQLLEVSDTQSYGSNFDWTLSDARRLIDAKANVNAVDPMGWTPLQNAIYRGNIDLVQLLLEQSSIDVNQVTMRHWTRRTALFIAAEYQPACIPMLVHCGANLFLADEDGEMALHKFLRLHHSESAVFSFLIEHGAGPLLFMPDNAGDFPVDRFRSRPSTRDAIAKAMEGTRVVYRVALSSVVSVSVLVTLIVSYVG